MLIGNALELGVDLFDFVMRIGVILSMIALWQPIIFVAQT